MRYGAFPPQWGGTVGGHRPLGATFLGSEGDLIGDLLGRKCISKSMNSRDLPSGLGDKIQARRFGDSETRRLGDSETQRLGDSETQRLGDSETRRL